MMWLENETLFILLTWYAITKIDTQVVIRTMN